MEILNNTVDLTANALDAKNAVLTNTHTAYDMASSGFAVLGIMFTVTVLFAIAVFPEKIKRIIYGYAFMAAVAVGILFVYGFVMSLGEVSILAYSFFSEVGRFVWNYLGYILITLLPAYYAGKKIEVYDGKV